MHSLAGTTVRGQSLDKLITLLEPDPLSAKLKVAIENGNNHRRPTTEERARLLEKLSSAPPGLGGLRDTLMKQLAGDIGRARRRDEITSSLERYEWQAERRGRGEIPTHTPV
jgi:hypothetical protein